MTFLTSSSYAETAKCLDNKRLNGQKLEAWIILRTNLGLSQGWKNHPICKAWAGFEYSLCEYGSFMSLECKKRGFVDNMFPKFREIAAQIALKFKNREPWEPDINLLEPDWVKDERILSSHRAALLAKKPDWYKQWNWKEEPKIDYVWPKQNT